MDELPDIPDVSHLCGKHRMDDARAAFEHYRTAWDLALYAPSISTYRAAVQAHDKCMNIIKGQGDGADQKH